MEKKVIDLEIIDDLEDSGVDAIALVDSPAIEKNWMFFKKEAFVEPRSGESESEYMGRCVPKMIEEGKPQDQAVAICISTYERMSQHFQFDVFAEYPWEDCMDDMEARGLDEESSKKLCGWIKANMQAVSYTDYPKAAQENAARALAYAEENGWGDCGTPVGKIRANQLAKGESVSIGTIARMAAFERHRQNSQTPYGEGCGKLMWDAWGGDEGIAWAQRKLAGIRENLEINTGGLPAYTQETGKGKGKKPVRKAVALAEDEENTTVGTYGYAEEKPGPNIFGYATRYFYMCPGAQTTFEHLMSMPMEDDTIGMTRSAALIADRVFQIEAEVIEKGEATMNQLKEAVLLVDDFYDIMHEIDEEVNMVHDVSYMDGHIEKISELVKQEVDLNRVLDLAKTLGFSAEDFQGNGMELNEIPDSFNLELAKGYTVYKYVGAVGSETRDFCRNMVNLDRYYTFEEIGQMGSQAVNPGFGLGGADTYSIWKYKGGPNCKHRWQKFYVTAEGTFQNKGPAPGTPGEKPIDMPNQGYAFANVADLKVGNPVSWKTADQNPRGRIREIVYGSKKVPGVDFVIQGTPDNPGYIIEIYEKKNGKWEPTGKFVGRKADSILKNVELWRQMFADEDKKELVGPVAIPDIEIPRRDGEGEMYFVRFSKAVIRRMAEKFMKEQRTQDNNIQHKDEMDAGSYVFESWVVENEEDKANSVYKFNVPVGTWMVKMRVTNANTWDRVKKGELNGFSLQGDFITQEQYQAYVSEKKQYEDLVRLVKSM